MTTMEKNKENAYLTCSYAKQCYSEWHREELYRKALETNDPNDWSKVSKVPIVTVLIDCFNMDCLMRKDYKLAMENKKEQEKLEQEKEKFEIEKK